jgi:hypothetical protein
MTVSTSADVVSEQLSKALRLTAWLRCPLRLLTEVGAALVDYRGNTAKRQHSNLFQHQF